MTIQKPLKPDYPGEHIKLRTDEQDLDFGKAKKIAKEKAEARCPDPMMLSWYQGSTGDSYPNLECGRGDVPAWILYAVSRGANMTIDINDGQYVFIYLCANLFSASQE